MKNVRVWYRKDGACRFISHLDIYRTFSSSAALPKFRVVLVLDRPITTASEAENLTARFTNLFNSVAPGA
ncbi:MAG: DUF2344 domain-containing protein, partial [Clostridia bacterium]|nr:DUF2344 domain-containing protein [Clostridia bacterium]